LVFIGSVFVDVQDRQYVGGVKLVYRSVVCSVGFDDMHWFIM